MGRRVRRAKRVTSSFRQELSVCLVARMVLDSLRTE